MKEFSAMPVPTHFKVTVRGDFLNSPEHWSFGFHLTRTNVANEDATKGDVRQGDMTAALTAFMASGIFSNKIEVRDWRLYEIGTNGKMQNNSPILVEFAPGILKGTSNGAIFPSQCSVAVSLIANNRGPAQRGRFFLPGVVTTVGDDWLLGDSVAGVIRGAATTFIKACSDAIDLDLANSAEVCNVSTGPPGSTTGTLQVVDHVEVGRVVDTIRNRRRSLLEQYSVGGHIDW
jgi:hypothetical protein